MKEQLYYNKKRTITGRFRQFIQDKKELAQEELIDFLDSINCNDPYGTFYSYKSQGFLKKIKVIYPEKTEFKKKVIKFIKNKKTIHQDEIVNFLRKIGHNSPKIYFGTLKYRNLFKGIKIIPSPRKKYLKEEERLRALKNSQIKHQKSEKFRITSKKWRQSAKGKKSAKKARQKQKLKKEYKVLHSIRNRMRNLLKLKKHKKETSTTKLIGCTRLNLILWLEKQFHTHSKTKTQMNWDNYGFSNSTHLCWEVDHIIPFSLIDLKKPETTKVICNFTNLRPMWRDENIKRFNKYNKDEVKKVLLIRKEKLKKIIKKEDMFVRSLIS